MNAIHLPSGDHEGDAASSAGLGQRLGLLGRHIEQIEPRRRLRQVALNVLLELVAVDHDRLRRLGARHPPRRRRAFVIRRIVRVAVRHHQQQLLAIRRPVVGSQPSLHIGELLRLAAVAVQQPNLVALRLARTAGEERQLAPVGTPARRALALRAGGHAQLLLAVPAAIQTSVSLLSAAASTVLTVYATHFPSGEICASRTSWKRCMSSISARGGAGWATEASRAERRGQAENLDSVHGNSESTKEKGGELESPPPRIAQFDFRT